MFIFQSNNSLAIPKSNWFANHQILAADLQRMNTDYKNLAFGKNLVFRFAQNKYSDITKKLSVNICVNQWLKKIFPKSLCPSWSLWLKNSLSSVDSCSFVAKILCVLVSLWLNNYIFSYEIPPTSSVVKRVSPSVVLVKGERITKTTKENMLIVNHSYSIGSGFIIGENGYILTCNHIIDGADTIQVELSSQKGYKAKLIKKKHDCDIALIQIDEEKLPVIVKGNPKDVKAGDAIIIIGNPMPRQIANPPKAFSHSVTVGVIASTERTSGNNKKLFQLSLPVNFGNSGGPLLNQYGEVIGIVNFKMTGFAGHNLEGVGFALSIDEAKDMLGWVKLSKKEEVFPTKKGENIYIIQLIALVFLIFILFIKMRENRWNNYGFIKKGLYGSVYKRDYERLSYIIKKAGKRNFLEKLVNDAILFKEAWVLQELNRQLDEVLSSKEPEEEKRKILEYKARIRRILRESF